jgi:hypothetical protein
MRRHNQAILLHHACMAATRLLRTALRNVTRKPTESALIERLASVPYFPTALIPQFEKFANEQGAEFLHVVNRWLEARQTKPGRGRKARATVLAGVHAFGFTEDLSP